MPENAVQTVPLNLTRAELEALHDLVQAEIEHQRKLRDKSRSSRTRNAARFLLGIAMPIFERLVALRRQVEHDQRQALEAMSRRREGGPLPSATEAVPPKPD